MTSGVSDCFECGTHVMVDDWTKPGLCEDCGKKMVLFTKRTNDPKLSWLERELGRAGIRYNRDGCSSHAPLLYVERSRLNDAWDILDPIDDISDDVLRWTECNVFMLCRCVYP